jgi:hypothetical protein
MPASRGHADRNWYRIKYELSITRGRILFFAYKARSLFCMLEAIGRGELLLPHIQRPFVWDDEQMSRLFDSLMRNYPVQTLLFWRTKEAIKARRFMNSIDRDEDLSALYDAAKSAADVEKTFVLDGQQRLQTLYSLFCGSVIDSHGRQREAYVNVTDGGEAIEGTDLVYRLVLSHEPKDLPYYRLRNLLERDAQRDAATIAYEIDDALPAIDDPVARRHRERQVQANMAQLRSLLREELPFWVEQLDGIANKYEDRKILDIFVRVNSGGTKLTASDLMFAALKEGWEDIEENTEQTVDMLNLDGRLAFEASFPLKCLLVAHGYGAEVNDVNKLPANAEKCCLVNFRATGTARRSRFRSYAISLNKTSSFFPTKSSAPTMRSYQYLIFSFTIPNRMRQARCACAHTITKRNSLTGTEPVVTARSMPSTKSWASTAPPAFLLEMFWNTLISAAIA